MPALLSRSVHTQWVDVLHVVSGEKLWFKSPSLGLSVTGVLRVRSAGNPSGPRAALLREHDNFLAHPFFSPKPRSFHNKGHSPL